MTSPKIPNASKIVATLALALAVLSAPAPARAGGAADEADLHFTIAAEHYAKGEFREALEHFLASNRLVPNRNVVFDIAETYAQLKAYPDAYRYYVQALEAEPDAGERARIEKSLQKVAHGVAVLRVRTRKTATPRATFCNDFSMRARSAGSGSASSACA